MTYTVRSANSPQGRSLASPSLVTSPAQRCAILDSRFRIFRMVAMWCVRQLSRLLLSIARRTSRNHSSSCAKDSTS